MIETILYGIPKDKTERYDEVLLLTNANDDLIERVKVMATKDGFHSFRVAHVNLSKVPNFAAAVLNAAAEDDMERMRR